MKKTKILYMLFVISGIALIASSCGGPVRRADKAWGAAARMLVTTKDDPWKYAEAIYAFGPRFPVVDYVTQKRTQALMLLASGQTPGLIAQDSDGPYFTDKTTDGRIVQEHRDQVVADLMTAQIDPFTGFVTPDGDDVEIKRFLLRSMAKIDLDKLKSGDKVIPGANGNELGWTLIAFSLASLTISEWNNEKEDLVKFDDLMKIALGRPVEWGSYSGLMEQRGIAVALSEYKRYRFAEQTALYEASKKKKNGKRMSKPSKDKIELKGVWKEAQKHVDGVIALMKKNQAEDGSFSDKWYSKKSVPKDVEQQVLYTGMALDYLMAALDEDGLNEPWVAKTVKILSRRVVKNRFFLYEKPWALTHAAHALQQYSVRVRHADQTPDWALNDQKKSGCCD